MANHSIDSTNLEGYSEVTSAGITDKIKHFDWNINPAFEDSSIVSIFNEGVAPLCRLEIDYYKRIDTKYIEPDFDGSE